ncbi:MAG: GDP-mannose 4,6-dehydratase [Microthrixaceae bacterium]
MNGRRVLVTGGEGFIGSHLVERLVADGADVRVLVYYNSFGRWGWLDTLPADVQSAIEVIPGDVRDSVRVDGAGRRGRHRLSPRRAHWHPI